MSYTLDFGADAPDQPSVQVATNRGWADLSEWADGLDAGKYPALMHLVDHGWEDDLPAVAADIEKALAEDRPEGDVADTLEGIAKAIRENEKAGFVVVSAGTPTGDEEVAGDEDEAPDLT